MKKTLTWVLVADGGQAIIYSNDGPNRGLEPVPGHRYETELPMDRELRSDRPGRGFDSGSGARHGISPPTDYHRLEKERFSEAIAETVEKAALAEEFDRLIVVAEPRTLGVLRDALGPHAKAKLIGDLDRNLTDRTAAQIAESIGNLLAA